MTRQVKEWVAKNDDQSIPDRVKLRVYELYNGNCAICTGQVLVAAYDHAVALVNGGQHRETNLQLLCVRCHKDKTKVDVAEKSRVYHKRLKAVGIKPKRRTIGGRKFNGTPVPPKWK